MKSFTAICLITLLAATKASPNGPQDLINCVKDCTDAVNDITSYIVKEDWFDGAAIGKIVDDIGAAVNDCSKVQSSAKEIVEWKYSQECINSAQQLVTSLNKMKSLLTKFKFKEFKTEFYNFKNVLEQTKRVCGL